MTAGEWRVMRHGEADDAGAFFGEHLVDEGGPICGAAGAMLPPVPAPPAGFALACRRCLGFFRERFDKVHAEALVGANVLRELDILRDDAKAALDIVTKLEAQLYTEQVVRHLLPPWSTVNEAMTNLADTLKRHAGIRELAPPMGPTFAEVLACTFAPAPEVAEIDPELGRELASLERELEHVPPELGGASAAAAADDRDTEPATPRARKRAPIGPRGPRKKR